MRENEVIFTPTQDDACGVQRPGALHQGTGGVQYLQALRLAGKEAEDAKTVQHGNGRSQSRGQGVLLMIIIMRACHTPIQKY